MRCPRVFSFPFLMFRRSDMLWADPIEESPENEQVEFTENDIRGCSVFYGCGRTPPKASPHWF
jgi:hypothetical protein